MTDTPGTTPSLGDRVRERRVSLHLSQQDLADLAGVSERFVRDAEHDKPTLRIDKLRAILAVLGLELCVNLRR